MSVDLSPPDDLGMLNLLSARIGADPALIQQAGGNTSVKQGAVMWIKASGTLLADALTRDVMVPVDLAAMRAALQQRAPQADQPTTFLLKAGGLRPSIETSLHAVFAHRVVVHVHCVETVALAIRTDARGVLAKRLAGEAWAFVDYRKPGAQLAAEVSAVLTPLTDVVVLGNHGLIVAADSVAEVETVLQRVCSKLAVDPGPDRPPDLAALQALAEGTGYGVAGLPTHQMALTALAVEQAAAGALSPDHVIFCGPQIAVVAPGETVADVLARAVAQGLPQPLVLIVPGAGVLLPHTASDGTKALARSLADVLRRVPDAAQLTYLTPDQSAELINWDAEKYRVALNVR